MKYWPFVVIAFLFLSGFTFLQDDALAVDRLIRDLGSIDFQIRERAEKELKKIGPPAEPALRKAAEDDDLERSTRAKRILDGLTKRAETTPLPKEDGILTLTDADSVSIAIADDKIRVEVTRNGAKEVYEAESMEEFREKYPEIAKKYGLSFTIVPGEKVDPLIVPHPPDVDDFLKEFEAMRRRLDDGLDDGIFRDLERIFRDMPQLRPEIPERPVIRPAERETPQPKFGVRVIPCTAEFRSQLGLDEDQGLVVSEVVPGSTAEASGLREHDVILTVNGRGVGDIIQFADVIRDAMVGEEIALEIVRKGERKTVTAKPEKKQ